MILADKIIELRKKAGLSQEELAQEIGVSRQAVSKWESAQSTPDMNKIVALSELFGVSTDYLLKDDVEKPEDAPAPQEPEPGVGADNEKLTPVDMETANAFLSSNEKNAVLVSIGVMLCIISPAPMIVLSGLGAADILPFSGEQGKYYGLAALIAFVAIAVILFINRGLRSEQYEYLKKEPLDTAYGVDGMVKERRKRYEGIHQRDIGIGIFLCVLCSVPLIIAQAISYTTSNVAVLIGIGVLLILVGIGVLLIVKSQTIWTGFQVLLEEGSYTRQAKKINAHIGGIYWGIALTIYLVISFLTGRWSITWIVWPIAGIVYSIVSEIMKTRIK